MDGAKRRCFFRLASCREQGLQGIRISLLRITSGLAISFDFLLKDSKRLLRECPRWHERCRCPSGRMCCGANFSLGLEGPWEMVCMGLTEAVN